MHEDRSCSAAEAVTPAREDRIVQSAVLVHVIDTHPAPIAMSELVREMASDAEDFGERDGAERAVRELADLGLLHRQGALVLPSRAALCAYDLFEGTSDTN